MSENEACYNMNKQEMNTFQSHCIDVIYTNTQRILEQENTILSEDIVLPTKEDLFILENQLTFALRNRLNDDINYNKTAKILDFIRRHSKD